MSKKKPIWIIVIVSIVVLLTTLTIYVNRVLLPVQIKKIAITQAKNFLKRNVEIGSLHFNWVKGLIVDDIRIYQVDSTDIFFQAERISMGIIFIPGFKEHTLTIPFVDILKPQVKLSRREAQDWNFSDLLVPPSNDKPSPVKVNLLGINVIDGHITIDDTTINTPFHQELTEVNVKIGLAVAGITTDASAHLAKTNGLLNIKGTYQPLSKSFDGHVYLKNIRPSQYLSLLPPLPDITLNDALINEINVDAHYDENLFSIKGDINATDINMKYGTIAIVGNVEASINQFMLKKGSINIDASVMARNAALTLSPTQIFKGNVSLEKVKIRQDKDGTQLVGTISGQNIDAAYEGQTFKGDILARPITLEMKNENDIDLKGDFKSNRLDVRLNENQSFSGKVSIDNAHFHLTNKKDLTFEGKVALDDVTMAPIADAVIIGSIDLKNVALSLKDDLLDIKTNGELNNWQVNLDKDKTIILETTFFRRCRLPP
jgi:hypothetical protein